MNAHAAIGRGRFVHSHAQARTHAEAHMPPRATPAFMPNRRMTCARSYPPTTEPPGESKTTAAIFFARRSESAFASNSLLGFPVQHQPRAPATGGYFVPAHGRQAEAGAPARQRLFRDDHQAGGEGVISAISK
jgi:hypothetical protein